MKTEITLDELLPNQFYINKEEEMVAEISLKRINMIGDILTQQYEEIERLNNELKSDENYYVKNLKNIIKEKDKEIEKLQNIIYEAKLILANKDTFKDYEYVIEDLEKVLNNI